MPQGGRRVGAGAPRGNLNAFKDGRQSGQLRSALGAADLQEWDGFLDRIKDDRRRSHARLIAALLIVRSRFISAGD